MCGAFSNGGTIGFQVGYELALKRSHTSLEPPCVQSTATSAGTVSPASAASASAVLAAANLGFSALQWPHQGA